MSVAFGGFIIYLLPWIPPPPQTDFRTMTDEHASVKYMLVLELVGRFDDRPFSK